MPEAETDSLARGGAKARERRREARERGWGISKRLCNSYSMIRKYPNASVTLTA